MGAVVVVVLALMHLHHHSICKFHQPAHSYVDSMVLSPSRHFHPTTACFRTKLYFLSNREAPLRNSLAPLMLLYTTNACRDLSTTPPAMPMWKGPAHPLIVWCARVWHDRVCRRDHLQAVSSSICIREPLSGGPSLQKLLQKKLL